MQRCDGAAHENKGPERAFVLYNASSGLSTPRPPLLSTCVNHGGAHIRMAQQLFAPCECRRPFAANAWQMNGAAHADSPASICANPAASRTARCTDSGYTWWRRSSKAPVTASGADPLSAQATETPIAQLRSALTYFTASACGKCTRPKPASTSFSCNARAFCNCCCKGRSGFRAAP